MARINKPLFEIKLLNPKNIPIWILMGSMYLISLLPYSWQYRLGRSLSPVLKKLLAKRYLIAKKNINLCFPKKSAAERDYILNETFANIGLAIIETGIAWFWSDKRVAKIINYSGLEHIKQAKDANKGILLVAIHNLNLELGARAFGLKNPGVGVYRPNTNPLYDWFQLRGRVRSNKYMLDRLDIRGMLKALKDGESVWYAPDHDYGHHRSVFVPLFAVEKTCTTTGTHILASRSKAAIIPYTLVRLAEGAGYELRIMPEVTDYPYDNKELGARRINIEVEKLISQAPEQYMWIHKRFKSRPDNEASFYE